MPRPSRVQATLPRVPSCGAELRGRGILCLMARGLKIAILLLGVLGCHHHQERVARPDAVRADEAIRTFVAQHRIPSAHVTIVRGDEVILQRGYGSIGPDGQMPDATSFFPRASSG